MTTKEGQVSGSSEAPEKKRKRATPGTTRKKKQQTNNATTTKVAANAPKATSTSATPTPSLPPLSSLTENNNKILIIDNGGDTIKYGWIDSNDDISEPQHIPNVTGRLPFQTFVLVGDEINTVKPNSLQQPLTRSVERGHITNMGNQIQVWKRLLVDILNVQGIPTSINNEASKAYGWSQKTKASKIKKGVAAVDNGQGKENQQRQHQPIQNRNITVLLLLQPFCPRVLIEQMLQVFFDDFGVSNVGFAVSSAMVANASSDTSPDTTNMVVGETNETSEIISTTDEIVDRRKSPCCCVVDVGWSATNVVPTYRGDIILTEPTDGKQNMKNPDRGEAKSSTSTIRKKSDYETTVGSNPAHIINETQIPIKRIALGGRHLINMMKHFISYRQIHLMDMEWIIRDIFERLMYFSMNYKEDLKLGRQVSLGKRPYDREYVLPDLSANGKYVGDIRMTAEYYRMKQIEEEERVRQLEAARKSKDGKHNEEDDDDDEDDEDYVEEEDGNKDDDNDGDNGDDDSEAEDEDDDEEETLEQKRRRIMKQRKEEEQRRREAEAEEQVLKMSVERFTIPEVLLFPSDAGLPRDMAGLPQAIIQSINACPYKFHAALYENILLVGGLSQLPNFQQRLYDELRCIVPAQYDVNISISKSPINQAWMGAKEFIRQKQKKSMQANSVDVEPNNNTSRWFVSRDEWEVYNRSKRSTSKKAKALSSTFWRRLLATNGGLLI